MTSLTVCAHVDGFERERQETAEDVLRGGLFFSVLLMHRLWSHLLSGGAGVGKGT